MKRKKIKTGKIFFMTAVVILLVAAVFLLMSKEKEPKLSADGVDFIPLISVRDCLEQIRVTNPNMTEQQANDNCYAIEAVNKNDASLCNKVSEGFRELCLAQFQ